MSVLIAADLSSRTTWAMRRGLQVASSLSQSAEVLHVVDADLPMGLREKTIEWAKTALTRDAEREAEALSSKAPAITVLAGVPKRDIALHAYRTAATLLVVGTHDPAKAGLFGFGLTTAGAIVRNSHIPILLVRDEAAAPYRDVVIGVDFSIYSTSAVKNAMRLFPGARLHLVHAYHVPFKTRLGTEEYLREIEGRSRASLETYLKQEIDVLIKRVNGTSAHAVEIQPHLIEGMAVRVLKTMQRQLDAGVIVIGTHGSSGIVRAIWGSVAEEIFDDPPCDVLVVHDH